MHLKKKIKILQIPNLLWSPGLQVAQFRVVYVASEVHDLLDGLEGELGLCLERNGIAWNRTGKEFGCLEEREYLLELMY